MDRAEMAHVPRDVIDLCERLRSRGKRAWIVGGCVRDLLLGRVAARLGRRDRRPPRGAARDLPARHPHRHRARHGHRGRSTGATTRSPPCAARGPTPTGAGPTGSSSSTTSRPTSRGATSPSTPSRSIRSTASSSIRSTARATSRARVLRAVGDPQRALLRGRPARPAGRALRRDARARRSTRPREAAIRPTLDTYRKVAAERVRDEWVKAMKARAPSRAFEVMRATGILEVTCPELLEGVGMEQNRWHAYDVWRHGMECMDACDADPVLRIAALLHDVGKPRTRAWSDKTQGLHVLRSRPGRRRDRRAHRRAPALLERRARAHRGARATPPLSLQRRVDATRRCAGGFAASGPERVERPLRAQRGRRARQGPRLRAPTSPRSRALKAHVAQRARRGRGALDARPRRSTATT